MIALGFGIGPWFESGVDPALRRRRLVMLGTALLVAFVALRLLNVYGDEPWIYTGDGLRTLMSFLALTKYPPSLLFLLPTLGLGALAIIGAAQMFFYVLHLCVLRVLYHGAYLIWGPTHGSVYGVDNLATVWAWYFALLIPLYFPTAWFSRLKARRRDIAWLKYF